VKGAWAEITLGGRISMAVAILWGMAFAGLLYLPYPFLSEIPADICSFLFVLLSTPLGFFSGVISTGIPSVGQWVAYFLLMIPNCFLIGYTLSAIWICLSGLWALVSGDGP
jgi:hypothetical protein